MTMSDWKRALNRFLEFNQLEVLIDKGTISHQQAEEKAVAEYENSESFKIVKSCPTLISS